MNCPSTVPVPPPPQVPEGRRIANRLRALAARFENETEVSDYVLDLIKIMEGSLS